MQDTKQAATVAVATNNDDDEDYDGLDGNGVQGGYKAHNYWT